MKTELLFKNSIKRVSYSIVLLAICLTAINPLAGLSQCPLPSNVGNIYNSQPNGSYACPGQSKSYYVNPTPGATFYTWVLPTGCTISGMNPYVTAGTTVTIDFGLTYTPPGDIKVTAGNACGNSAQRSRTILPYSPGVYTPISGTLQACPGDNGTYSVANEAGVTYSWIVPTGVSISSGQGTNSINVAFNAGFTATGQVKVSGTYGCGTYGPQSSKAVYQNMPVSPGPVSGPDVACPNDIKTYSVAPGANITNYIWTAPSGCTVISGQGTTTCEVQYSPGFVQGTVSVKFQNGCATTNNSNLTVRATTTIPGLISGAASGICNTSETYTIAPLLGASFYTWTAPAGASIISGQGTTSCTISFPSSVSGNISVSATNSCGTSAARTKAVTGNIVISSQPANAGYCEDDTVSLNVTVPGGGLSFQWRKDGIDISDGPDFSGTQTASLTFLKVDSLNAGNYDVIVTSTCAPSVTSNAAAIQVNMKPPVPGPITAPFVACPGYTGILLFVPAGGYNTLSNFWEVSSGTTIVSGQGTPDLTVDFGPTNHSGYTIRCWGENGCGLSRDTSKTWIRTSVSVPFITAGPELVCQGQTNVDYVANPVTGATSYTWTSTPGITINSGQNTLNLNVDFSSNFTSGSVCVTASNQCMTTAPRCRQIVHNVPSLPGNIQGQFYDACNQTLNYSVPPANGAISYNWSVPSGSTIVSGQGSNAISVSFGSGVNGQICVNGISSCTNGPSRCFNVKSIPQTPASVSSSSPTICANQTGVIFTATSVTGAHSYAWTVPSGASIVSGQGTISITVNFGTNGGQVGVRAQNTCGNSGTRVYNVSISCKTASEFETTVSSLNLDAYPNPAQNKVTVSFNAPVLDTYEITITDLLGKNVVHETVLADQGLNKSVIDLKGINKGLYLVTLKSSDTLRQMRIVIN